MSAVKPPFFLRWFSPRYLVCDLPSTEKVIYLTFDDGPIPEITPEILEILEQFDVKATFFMVGDNVRKHQDIYQQVIEQGHAVGNHTFHHLNGWKTTPGSYIEDVYRCSDLVKSPLFRPPYGRFTPSQYLLLKKDYRFILWSVLSYDFHKRTTPESCLANVINNTGNGSVVVFHDNIKSIEKVRYTLPRFLEHFLNNNFQFDRLHP
ncbi:MAG: polysaccharide deacetylase family protein [Bacteroidetes bacterium]|nr:polysaccharide deacetylase family protein [Bacteroidota bacterium]